MIIHDNIYGKESFREPILIELIKSKPIQRLKKISQFGLPDEYYSRKGFSRYEHSVGVLVLLRKLGASLEEQTAGLLHDVSHMAFSHIADFVFGYGRNENMQDLHHREFVLKSSIKNILQTYNYSPEKIANLKRFRLLEKRSPHLCADRIDYCFREFTAVTSKKNLTFCLQGLIVNNKEIIFINRKAAEIFAYVFLELQDKHWGGFEAKARFDLMSKVLKDALKRKVISKDDFYRDDWHIIKKINRSEDNDLKHRLKILRIRKLNPKIYNKVITKKKFRYADPKFIENGRIFALSQVDKKFAQKIKEYRNKQS